MTPVTKRISATLLAAFMVVIMVAQPAAAKHNADRPQTGMSDREIGEIFGPDPAVTGDDAATVALTFLMLEAVILAELDAFDGPVSPLLAKLADAFDVGPEMSEFLVEELDIADKQAEFYSTLAVGLGYKFSDAQWELLDFLHNNDIDEIGSGGQIRTPADEYDKALQTFVANFLSGTEFFTIDQVYQKEFDFMDRAFGFASEGPSPLPGTEGQSPLPGSEGQSPEADSETQAELDAVVEELESTQAALAETQADVAEEANQIAEIAAAAAASNGSAPESETELKPWVIPAGLILLLAALAFIVLAFKRRKTKDSDSTTNRDVLGLLEVGRRMTASMDPNKIAAIAVEQSLSLVQASSGAFITSTPECQDVLYATSTSLLDLDSLGEGLLSQTVQTGLSIRSTATTDPAIQSLPAALLLTPIVADGKVEAVILLGRDASNPFQPEDADAITQLAPLIGSALFSANAHKQSAQLALVDGLTELGNRRRLDDELEALVTENLKLDRPVAFAMLDVDHFKNYNDTNGHSAGDEALRQVADIAKNNVRPQDLVYRYGGEEFCILLPNATLEEASNVAERVRSAIEKGRFSGDGAQPLGTVTISIGLAAAESTDPNELIRAADAALYEAKETGRNRVNTAPQPA